MKTMKYILTICMFVCVSISCTSGTSNRESGEAIVTDSDIAANGSDDSDISEQDTGSDSRELPDTMTIAMCGDIMMGTTYPNVQLPPNDGRDVFKDTKHITQRADLAVGNLEGTLCDDGKSRKSPGPNSYSFRTPTKYAVNLTDAGYDFMSMANNHSRDFGDHGIEMSEKTLDAQGIAYAGVAGRREYAIVERNGVKYGICAFGHNSYTIKHTELQTVKRILNTLRPLCDILIVSFHGGAEGADRRSLPEGQENYLGENRGNLRQFTHFCIDNGVDVIYGHGPHVTRCVEVYKNKFIAYSLGNFCTPYGMSLIGIKGYAPVVEIKIDSKGNFISGKIHSFIQQKGAGPRTDASNSVAKEMKTLSEQDIKNPIVTIDNEGNIRMKNEK